MDSGEKLNFKPQRFSQKLRNYWEPSRVKYCNTGWFEGEMMVSMGWRDVTDVRFHGKKRGSHRGFRLNWLLHNQLKVPCSMFKSVKSALLKHFLRGLLQLIRSVTILGIIMIIIFTVKIKALHNLPTVPNYCKQLSLYEWQKWVARSCQDEKKSGHAYHF